MPKKYLPLTRYRRDKIEKDITKKSRKAIEENNKKLGMKNINKSLFSSKKRNNQRNKKNEINLFAKLRDVTVIYVGRGTNPSILAAIVISEIWPPACDAAM